MPFTHCKLVLDSLHIASSLPSAMLSFSVNKMMIEFYVEDIGTNISLEKIERHFCIDRSEKFRQLEMAIRNFRNLSVILAVKLSRKTVHWRTT